MNIGPAHLPCAGPFVVVVVARCRSVAPVTVLAAAIIDGVPERLDAAGHRRLAEGVGREIDRLRLRNATR
jgi:hypothetical protein